MSRSDSPADTARAMRQAVPKRVWLWVAPLVVFLLAAFVLPLADLVNRSVHRPEMEQMLPHTGPALDHWNGQGVPPERAQAALARDLARLAQAHRLVDLRRALPPAARAGVPAPTTPFDIGATDSYRRALLAIDPAWGQGRTWLALRSATKSFTLAYYDRALTGEQPGGDGGDRNVLLRTVALSAVVTAITLALALPLTAFGARMPGWASALALPLWASWVGATVAVMLVLQSQGVVNNLLVALGCVTDGDRPQLLYNVFGTGAGLVYLALPPMGLWLLAWMRRIPAQRMRAARSLGAGPVRTFWRVYLPALVPGLAIGALVVFTSALGALLVPSLLGGQAGALVGNRIIEALRISQQPHTAAALGVILVAIALPVYAAISVLVAFWHGRHHGTAPGDPQ